MSYFFFLFKTHTQNTNNMTETLSITSSLDGLTLTIPDVDPQEVAIEQATRDVLKGMLRRLIELRYNKDADEIVLGRAALESGDVDGKHLERVAEAMHRVSEQYHVHTVNSVNDVLDYYRDNGITMDPYLLLDYASINLQNILSQVFSTCVNTGVRVDLRLLQCFGRSHTGRHWVVVTDPKQTIATPGAGLARFGLQQSSWMKPTAQVVCMLASQSGCMGLSILDFANRMALACTVAVDILAYRGMRPLAFEDEMLAVIILVAFILIHKIMDDNFFTLFHFTAIFDERRTPAPSLVLAALERVFVDQLICNEKSTFVARVNSAHDSPLCRCFAAAFLSFLQAPIQVFRYRGD